MSDIFYTQVDPNLQIELNERGQAGRYRRNNKHLQFMLEKIANVQLIPYNDPERKTIIDAAILGGKTVRGAEYLPSGPNGFLSDRTYKFTENAVENNQIVQKTKEERTNSSRRIPPFITSLDVNIGDSSMALLNDATINITVPNPERDLNFIESVYLRPGRAVSIEIIHPDSAIVSYETTSGLLTSSMASADSIRALYPNVTKTRLRQYQKMNGFVFDGLIKSFTLDYQPDMSVNITLSMTGTSQTYADTSLIINSQTPKTEESKNISVSESNIDAMIGGDQTALVTDDSVEFASESLTSLFTGFSPPPPLPPTSNVATPEQITLNKTELGTFYTNLNKEIQELIDYKEKGIPRVPAEQRGYTDKFRDIQEIQQYETWAVWGEPIDGKIAYQKYVQLAWIIDFLNRQIISKRKLSDPLATIICTEQEYLCESTYYENMVSADPLRIWLAGDKTNPTDLYGTVLWNKDPGLSRDEQNYTFSETVTRETINSDGTVFETIEKKSFPTRIFINLEVIQEICKIIEDANSFTVAEFLDKISREIYYATAGAIDMKLITHPELPEFLLFYDAKYVNLSKPVIPYSIPMFSNHSAGTIVRDFKFSGKLPTDVSNLAYVVNQDPSEISESEIAPYVSYMYAANTVTRTGPDEAIGTMISEDQLADIRTKYKEAHLRYIEALNQAKIAFGNDVTNPEKQSALKQALEKHLQYPKETIEQSNQLVVPVIPFEAEFTIDGINGFRVGDVLTFDGLPTRYKQNSTFSIMNITHTVGTDGQWTTTIRCVMRANIDVQL